MNISPTDYAAYLARKTAPDARSRTRARRGEGRVGKVKRQSALELRFIERWTLLGGPPLEREYRAVPGRKWRYDFAHVSSRTLIELHGGIFSGGRHTTGMGFVRDREKMRAARRLGWIVEELTEKNLKADEIEWMIRDVEERAFANADDAKRARANGKAEVK